MTQDSPTFTGLPELPVDPLWVCLWSNSDSAVGVVALNDSQAIPMYLFPFTHSSAKLSPPRTPCVFVAQCTWRLLYVSASSNVKSRENVPSGHPSQSISNASFTGGRGAVAAGTGGRAGRSS